MTAQQLKNSILQMAVQGKLVPQIPSDEPASVLLERIRAEKEKLIKAGKIKKEKNPSVIFRGSDNLPYEKTNKGIRCIADEIPFEIPDSWEWCRCMALFQINPRHTMPDEMLAGFMSMPMLQEGFQNSHSFEMRRWSKIKNGFTHFQNGDIVIAKITPCFQNRKSAIISGLPNDCGAGSTELHVLRDVTGLLFMPFFLWIFKTHLFIEDGKKHFTGTAGQQRIGKDFISTYLIPLPSLFEQERIVAKIEELLPHIEEYDRVEQKLDKLNTEFPEQLKKSILQWAIQGKLLPQNPDDEPASVLLDRIRAEKAKLVKAGKIKKDKVESVIFRRDNSHYEKLNGVERCIDDEIPFEIPASWEWVRLGALITLLSGQDFSPSEYNSHHIGIPYITGASNIENGVILINRWTDSPHNIALRGDLLIVCKGAGVGKMAILDLTKVHIARQIMAIRGYNLISNKYLMLFLTAQVNKIRAKMNGLIPGIDRNVMLNFLTPLPPLAEQKRIVAEIKKVLSLQQTMRR